MTSIDEILNPIDNFLWYIAFLILIPLGIYFTIKFKCLQIREVDESCRLTAHSGIADKKSAKTRISTLESFLMSLGARVGIGNIAGVASAIIIGGPGAIFWMWIFTIIISILGFAEAVASQMYKVRNENGICSGGPSFYTEKAFKNHRLAIVMAVLMIVLYGIPLMIVNTSVNFDQIRSVTTDDLTTTIAIIGFMLFISIVIIGGIKRVANACKALVPLMLVSWVAICVVTMIVNWQNVGNAFYMIVHYAFVIPDGITVNGFLSIEGLFDGLKTPLGGLLGTVVILGLRKCVFSNESGVGSISALSGSAESTHPVKLGYIQTLAVLIDTLVICTLTAVTVLSFSDFQALLDTGLSDSPLVTKVISDAFLGDLGGVVLTMIILVCAVSSIVSFYGIVETTSTFISKEKWFLNGLKIMVIISLFIGCVTKVENAYSMVEILMATCAIPHMVIIFRLRKNISAAYRDYRDQKKAGIKDPVFHKDAVPNQEGITEWD